MKIQVAKKFQNFLLNVDTRFQLLMGSYGSGKSYAIALKVLLRCLQRDNYRVAIVRNNFSTHKNTTYKLLKGICKEHTTIKASGTSDIYFNNGSEIIFLGAEDPEKLKSLVSVDLIWCEELSEFSQDSFEELIGRQRGVENPEIICSTNPLSESHWFVNVFFKLNDIDMNEFYGNEFTKHTTSLGEVYYNHSTVMDNPFVGNEYVESLKRLKITNPFKYTVGFLGRLGVLGDLVFPNHTVKDMGNIHGEVIFGLDLGFAVSYNCCLRGVLRGNLLYITHEYYSKGKITRELGTDIKQWAATNNFSLGTIWTDHNPQLQTELRAMGVQCANAEKIGKVEGFHRVREYEVVIHPRCKQLIADMSTLQYREIKGVKYEDKFNFDSHTCDSLAYMLSYKKPSNFKGNSQMSVRKANMPKY